MENVFAAAAAQAGSIEALCDGFFAFLKARTDFYVIQSETNKTIGTLPSSRE